MHSVTGALLCWLAITLSNWMFDIPSTFEQMRSASALARASSSVFLFATSTCFVGQSNLGKIAVVGVAEPANKCFERQNAGRVLGRTPGPLCLTR